MKTALLVDASFAASPIYRALEAEGVQVSVCGKRPDDYLARVSRHYLSVDYSRPEVLEELVNRHDFDYVVPGCNDVSYKAVARLAKGRHIHGVDSLETAEALFNKDSFRRVAERAGFDVPEVYSSPYEIGDNYAIFKPVDGFSGNGMTVLGNGDTEQIETAIAHAKSHSSKGSWFVEEYVSGSLVSHSSFIEKGCIVRDFLVEERSRFSPFLVDTSRVLWERDSPCVRRIRDCSQRVAGILGLQDGLLHIQMIIDEEHVYAIEATRRLPGDLYGELIARSTGYPYNQAYTKGFTGQVVPLNGGAEWEEAVVRHTVIAEKGSMVGSLSFDTPISIDSYLPLSKANEVVDSRGHDRVAIFFARAAQGQPFEDLFCSLSDGRAYRIGSI